MIDSPTQQMVTEFSYGKYRGYLYLLPNRPWRSDSISGDTRNIIGIDFLVYQRRVRVFLKMSCVMFVGGKIAVDAYELLLASHRKICPVVEAEHRGLLNRHKAKIVLNIVNINENELIKIIEGDYDDYARD